MYLKNASSLRKSLTNLFSKQKLAGLATSKGEQPYTSLVAFVATDNLRTILFATDTNSTKYSNVVANRRVSMLVDNRTNRATDFYKGMAVTVIGQVQELEADQRTRYLKSYLKKHPYLGEFVKSPNCSLLRINVETYRIVTRFQQVMELHIKR
jgi:nitroimidazol reductase NimA-like FMN-containing flavoprotein (pyridoxamine 5'-phosphate oxidase superfamily)